MPTQVEAADAAQFLLDRAQIADVLTRYTHAIDADEFDLLDDVFTPDAQIDYTESGGIADTFAKVKPWLAEMLPAFFPKRLHMLGQIGYDFSDPDHCSVTAYFFNPMPADDGKGGSKLVQFGGIYRHQFVRTDAGWRSEKLYESVTYKDGM